MNATPPIGQRRWMSIPAVQWTRDSAHLISKAVTRILRHKHSVREADGVVEWEKLLSWFNREEPSVDLSDWRTQE